MVYLIHENKKCNWGKLRDVKMNGYTNKERKGNDNRKRKEKNMYMVNIKILKFGEYILQICRKSKVAISCMGKDQLLSILIIFVTIRAQRLTCIQLQKN